MNIKRNLWGKPWYPHHPFTSQKSVERFGRHQTTIAGENLSIVAEPLSDGSADNPIIVFFINSRASNRTITQLWVRVESALVCPDRGILAYSQKYTPEFGSPVNVELEKYQQIFDALNEESPEPVTIEDILDDLEKAAPAIREIAKSYTVKNRSQSVAVAI